MPPVYQANTWLIVNEKPSATRPTSDLDIGQVQTYRFLGTTYVEIIIRRVVLQVTIDALKLPETVKQLTAMTTEQVRGQTEIIAVSVKDKDASPAAFIANTLAKSFSTELLTLVNRLENVSIIDRTVLPTRQVIRALCSTSQWLVWPRSCLASCSPSSWTIWTTKSRRPMMSRSSSDCECSL